MDTKSWISALELFLQYPLLSIVTFVIACAAAGFAWWLRGHLAQSKLDLAQAKLNAQEMRLGLRERASVIKEESMTSRLEQEQRLKGLQINTELRTMLSRVTEESFLSCETMTDEHLVTAAQTSAPPELIL
jgi:hypothetical protein